MRRGDEDSVINKNYKIKLRVNQENYLTVESIINLE